MSPFSPAFSLREPRHPGLDAARGFAVVAMVLGHTLDALLSPAMREHPWVQRYWELRGLTAPLFLLVSGWAVVAALGGRPRAAVETFGRRVRRALLLLFLGYFLKWPGWAAVKGMGWGETMQAHVFAFDALQCIGVSLLVGAVVLVLTPDAWSRAGALLALAVGVPMASAALWQAGEHLPEVLRQAVGSPGSRFPLFPWMGFFFAGALGAHVLRLLRPGWPQGLALAVLGAGLMWGMKLLPADWSPTSPWLVAWRVGQGLLVLAVVNMLPTRLSRGLAPLGRMSLWLYVLHLPVVYGWANISGLSGRVGPVLSFGQALGVGVALLLACYVVALAGKALLKLARPWQVGSTTLSSSIGSGQRV
ncbi:acyltransferase [Myxococcaceae bacterium GXIMD 01537]